jgi:hypothetical protein
MVQSTVPPGGDVVLVVFVQVNVIGALTVPTGWLPKLPGLGVTAADAV